MCEVQTGIDWVPQSIDGWIELIGLDLFPGSELINPLRIHLVVNLVTYDVKIKLLNMCEPNQICLVWLTMFLKMAAWN